ncbi:MAG: hypothetical protein ACR2KB_05670 [Chitinophagaceae bacterium]
MMPVWILELLRYSILIAAVIAVFRYRKVENRYHPFFYLIWIGVINEITTTILVQNGYYNIINSTIYSFIEAILILWLFFKFSLFRTKTILLIIILIIFAAYIIEEYYIRFLEFNSYSRIIKNFIIVLCSISMINKLLVEEKSIIVKHPMFILSICFIVYFIMGIVVEAFFVYTLPFTELFKKNIMNIIYVLNLIINFIYAFVFLLMPAKKNNNFKQVQYV